MISEIIQELYVVVNNHKNRNETIAALKAIQAALEHEILVEQAEGYQQMIAKQMFQGGDNH